MQRDSRKRISIQMIIHCAMGVLLGAIFGLALIFIDRNILQFIVSSSSPSMNMALFIGYFSFMVGTGATTSGFFFTAIELNASKAKQQAKRINQWRGPDNGR